MVQLSYSLLAAPLLLSHNLTLLHKYHNICAAHFHLIEYGHIYRPTSSGCKFTIFISRRPVGPGREIIKCLMSVRACVRPFVTFYKRLHNSFVFEHKFTKLRQQVYVNKVMSFLAFGLILKNKMATRAIFRFFFIFQNALTQAVL